MRWMAIAWAQLRCFAYLLFVGMWRGEMQYTGYDRHDRIQWISACTGSLLGGNLKWTRTFYGKAP